MCILEIAFLIDTTSSMQPYINESKNTMVKIINEINDRMKNTKFAIKYAVVAYRDHYDEKISYLTKHIEFSNDTDVIK